MTRNMICLLALTALAGSVAAERTVDEMRDMQPDGRLSFSATSGEFEIIGSRDEQLHILGALGPEVKEMRITGDAGHWKIELEAYREDRRRQRSENSRLTIFVPHGTEIDTRTISANVSLEGLEGRAVGVRSVSGNVDLTAVTPRRLSVETVSGAQHLDGGGRTESRLQSVSGNISASGLDGRIRAQTVSGNIAIDAERLEDMDAQTVSGRINIAAAPQSGTRISLMTHSGAIRLGLPGDTAVDVRAESFSGRINSQFGGEPQRGMDPGQRLAHRTGDGNVRLS
jgi:DUF4097 and DUF4098 domain-containing protein YvlB